MKIVILSINLLIYWAVLLLNRIGLLPDSYSNLPMLKVIDVSHNCLKDFPPGVLSIKSLEVSLCEVTIVCTIL